jgi:hypothetical protein
VQEAIEVLHTAFGWKIPFVLHGGHFSLVQMPQNGTVVLTGLRVSFIAQLFLALFFTKVYSQTPLWACSIMRA